MSKKTISARINVSEINKEWMYKGEKGIYLDVMMYVNDERDQYDNNGMIVQAVPKEIREREKDMPKEKRTSGAILGNCKVFEAANKESSPGASLPFYNTQYHDLPF